MADSAEISVESGEALPRGVVLDYLNRGSPA